MIQQRRYRRTLGCGLLIQKTPRAVLADHKLFKHRHESALCVSCSKQAISRHSRAHSHLKRFVKPAVSAVGERPAAMKDLRGLAARIPVN